MPRTKTRSYFLSEERARLAYFLAKKGLKSIQNVINGLGLKLSSNDMACPYNLGLQLTCMYCTHISSCSLSRQRLQNSQLNVEERQ